MSRLWDLCITKTRLKKIQISPKRDKRLLWNQLLRGSIPPDSKVRDHLLLTIQAVINGTPVRALVDSGATRSFVDERLRLHPPLQFIGAYSSLEMANGETIVSTGVAPDVLISLGDIQFRSTLTAMPMMEGFDLILGKDWLDMVNPLVD